MNPELSSFAARLLPLMREQGRPIPEPVFNDLALELFALQFAGNLAYRKICEARRQTPRTVEHWTQVPALPTAAFKELDVTAIPPEARAAVFHSSGTTEQRPSRHHHGIESLAVYEASLWSWFQVRVGDAGRLIFLTPDQKSAPHSSLVHMFETVRQRSGRPESAFVGCPGADGSWGIDFAATVQQLKSGCETGGPVTLLGTAFSFVHLLDFLAEHDLSFHLPDGSRVMETGGYKNRSRAMPKAELHALITGRLGVPARDIVCEYGMSELSSQAYDSTAPRSSARHGGRVFQFPPWARAQIISPETGRAVAGNETGLIRVFDLANVFSAAAIQTEDLGIGRGDGFELMGRARLAEPRGCSLMTA